MTGPGRILVIDTATTLAVIALGEPDGTMVAERGWVAGYRHGEELLARIDALLTNTGLAPRALGGIVVGTGPGAFTGLRVGIATAKAMAYALDLRIVGVSSGAALLAAAAAAVTSAPAEAPPPGHPAFVLLQPAGLSDRVLSRPGMAPVILPGGTDPELAPGERLVAVDLDGRAPAEASALGARAHDGLAAALLAAGAARLVAGDPDGLAELVPEYVTLPRGVRAALPDSAVDLTGGAPRP